MPAISTFAIDPGVGIERLDDSGERRWTIASTGEESIQTPQQLGVEPDGVAWGPLVTSVAHSPEDDEPPILGIDRLEWAPEDSDDGAWLLGIAGIGAAAGVADEEETAARRGVLATAAAVIGLGAIGTATAQDGEEGDEQQDLVIARGEISRADAPYWIGVLDAVDGALPIDEPVHIEVDGTRVESVEDPEYDHVGNGEVLPAGTTGEFRAYVKGAVGRSDRIGPWVSGMLPFGGEPITATFSLPEPAASMDPGEQVTVTTNRAIVTAAADPGNGDESVVELGDQGIPHAEESAGQERGHYAVREVDGQDALVYEAAEESPDAQLLRVEFRAGSIASTLDAIDRR